MPKEVVTNVLGLRSAVDVAPNATFHAVQEEAFVGVAASDFVHATIPVLAAASYSTQTVSKTTPQSHVPATAQRSSLAALKFALINVAVLKVNFAESVRNTRL